MFLSSSPPARVAAFFAVPLAIAAIHPATARSQEVERPATSLAITSVTVIDVREGVVRPDMTVIVTDGHITAVRRADSVEVPAGARVVDGSGKYLIPGLWDMHSHTWGGQHTRSIVFPLEIAHGVVGIRNMAGDCYGDSVACADRARIEELRSMRQEIEAGELIGPDIYNASTFLDGPHSIKHEALILTTPTRARQAVREHARRGFDLLKVYDYLPREVYFALADEARKQEIPFAGHVPWTVTVEEAARAGQVSIDHGFGLWEAASGKEEAFTRERRDVLHAENFTRQDRYDLLFAPPDGQFLRMIDREEQRFRFSEEDLQETIQALRKHGTWLAPTLAMNVSRIRLNPWRDGNLLAYVPASKRQRWEALISASRKMAPSERAFRELITSALFQMLGQMHEAGVGILAGTDCDVDLVLPGFHLHEELTLMVEAGLTPAAALRTATLNAARYLGRTAEMGTVEEGKAADLVLLEANPLEDISHTQEIAAVVLNGRYLDRAALDELLTNAERAANQLDAARDSVSSEDRSPAGELQSDTVHVAPPTGEKETDRASILAALEEVEPGGTVLFSPGTYLVGEFVRVEVPRITLQGHSDGTTLRGCDPDDYPEYRVQLGKCNGLELKAGHITIRDLTIEHAWHGIYIGCCLEDLARSFRGEGEGPPLAQPGGHLIEDNRLRSVGTAMRVIGQSVEPIVIRDNVFRNVAHALVINGGTAHVLDNDIAAPEPERVPSGRHPLGAIGVFPAPPARECGQNEIADNRIEGHPDGIGLAVGVPGTRCERNVVRNNTIIVRRVPIGESGQMVRIGSESDSTVVGVPIDVGNVTGDEGSPLPPTWRFEGEAAIGNHLIEGNQVQGADGIGIEIRRSSDNRIVDNVVTGIDRRELFPGNVANSADPEAWRDANGSGIWLSPGSDGNEIVGNTFEDVAAAAVFLEGDYNRVELRSASDGVRDLGSGNRVSIAESTSGPAEDGLSGGNDADSSLQRSPLVCIDEGHQERHTAGGTYALFAGWLRAEGFRVDAFTAPFKQGTLKRCRVLVVANALHARNQGNWALPTPSAFTPEEIEGVRSWVRDGGGLLLIADHMPFPGAARDLGDTFGLRFSNGFAVDTAVEGRTYGPYRGSSRFVFRHRDGSLASHPITEGLDGGASLDSVVTYTGQVFRAHGRFQPLLIAPAGTISLLPQEAWQFDEETPVMDTGRWLQGAAAEFGTGRVVALGEAAQFRPDDRGEARGGNAAFATNVVRWLAGLDAP